MTIKQIAILAGVSTSTISRVLNDSGYVKEEVRKKIEAVIRETGYVPSSVAKDLKRKDTDFIGVIIPKINSSSIGDLVSGVEKILSKNGLQMLLATTNNNSEKEIEYLNLFKEKRVKGILILGTELSKKHEKTFKESKIPLVLIGQSGAEFKVSSVTQKDRESVKDLVKLAIENGHREIGYIGVESWDRSVGAEREAGYLEALRENNIQFKEENIYLGDFSDKTPIEGVRKIIDKEVSDKTPDKVTAIISATDTFAIKIISELRKRGIKVPEDISVLGVGNSEIGRFYYPPLTTIDYNYLKTGEMAVELLLKKISGEVKIENLEMEYTIILRESLKRLK